MTEQYKLKQDDMVVMHTCMEHDHPDNFGKIWRCKTDSFRHKGHDYDSIFLDGFSGSFSAEFLQKVVLPAPSLVEAQEEIKRLTVDRNHYAEIGAECVDDRNRLERELAEARIVHEREIKDTFVGLSKELRKQLVEAQQTIADKDAEIRKQTDLKLETYQANAEWQEQYEKSQAQAVRLRKALEETLSEAESGLSGSIDRADEAINKIVSMCNIAIGEEVES